MFGSGTVGQRRRERGSVHRLLVDTVDRVGLGDASELENRGSQVDDVGELCAQPAAVVDAIGPVHDQRVTSAAEVRTHLLAPLERRVPGPCPRSAVVGIHDCSTPLLQPTVTLRELELHLVSQRDAVLHRQLVERAGDGALHAGAVVTPDPHDHRVVELTQLLDGVDHPTDVVVRVLREPGVDLHLARVERLQIVSKAVPRWKCRVAGRELGVGRDHPEFLLASERLFAELVPALVELARVLVGPILGDMVRSVTAPSREVQEEGLVCVLSSDPVQPLDAAVRHRIREVVRLLLVVELGRSADDLLVLGQARVPLARPATEDPVEVVETPPVGPPVEGPGRTLLAVGREVPLPERGRAVPVVLENSRERHAVAWQSRRVTREATGELTDRTEAHRMVVPSGQEAPRGSASTAR